MRFVQGCVRHNKAAVAPGIAAGEEGEDLVLSRDGSTGRAVVAVPEEREDRASGGQETGCEHRLCLLCQQQVMEGYMMTTMSKSYTKG